jgi:phosphate transport system ATP-binding protein
MTSPETADGRRPSTPTGRQEVDRPAISVRNLTIRYGTAVAVRDVTLDVSKQSVTSLIGPSGCGKTSFLCSLNRLTDLIPGCSAEGEIRVGDVDVRRADTDLVQLRRRVGMIFQRPAPFPFSVRRNLDLPLREHGVRDARERAEIAERSLRDVGLWDEVKDRLDKPATKLSGGQQQRLCLARALALRPEILLLDEPCSALDPISSGVIEDLILELKTRYAIVVVTHNLPQARRISDRTALLWKGGEGGTLIEHGETDRLFSAPQNPITAAYVEGRVG